MSFNRTAFVRGAQGLIFAGILVSAFAAVNQNNIKGTVVGKMLGQPQDASKRNSERGTQSTPKSYGR